MKNYSGGYETHFPVLAACVAMTKGPVVELGCGWFSTPMLHMMCRAMGRSLYTIESDAEWASNFLWMQYDTTSTHCIYSGKGWREPLEYITTRKGVIPEYERNIPNRFGICFVDYKPGEERKDIVAFMADKADIIIAHDSERDFDSGANYEYETVKPMFKYVKEYRLMRPYTLILSNTIDFPLSEEEQTWHPDNL